MHIVRRVLGSASAAAKPSDSPAAASPLRPEDGPPAKRQRTDNGDNVTGSGSSRGASQAAADGDDSSGGGLAGLLGGYGSSSDSE